MRDGSGMWGEGTQMLVRRERVDLDVARRGADEEMGGGKGKRERGDGVVGVFERDDSALGLDWCRSISISTDGFPFILRRGGGGGGLIVIAEDGPFSE